MMPLERSFYKVVSLLFYKLFKNHQKQWECPKMLLELILQISPLFLRKKAFFGSSPLIFTSNIRRDGLWSLEMFSIIGKLNPKIPNHKVLFYSKVAKLSMLVIKNTVLNFTARTGLYSSFYFNQSNEHICRIYYLKADSQVELAEWLAVIRERSINGQRKSILVDSSTNMKEDKILSRSGHLFKLGNQKVFKLGNQKVGKKEWAQRWCVLHDTNLYYYKTKQVSIILFCSKLILEQNSCWMCQIK
jgi:hypothetical protein